MSFSSQVFACSLSGDADGLRNVIINNVIEKNHWTGCRRECGDTPLHVAARHGHLEIVRYLVEQSEGEDFINVCNNLGKSALHEAAHNCFPGTANYLLEHGADANQMKTGDWTPLMLASTRLGFMALQTVQKLVKHGADPHIINKDGWTALHIACRTGHCDIVRFLLENFPALANIRSTNGRYPLHTASLHGHITIVCQLLKYNSSIMSAYDMCGVTPLIECCRGNRDDVAQHLLMYGASVTESDNMGLTSLHVAAQTGSWRVIQLLIKDWNVDVNLATEKFKLTPLHCAANAGQLEVVRMLLLEGADLTVEDVLGRRARDLVCSGPKRDDILTVLEEYELCMAKA